MPLAQEKKIGVMVNLPFHRGRLFKAVKDKQLPAWSAEFDCTSWAQFFLKYVISHPAVTCVIPRTGNPHHMADNLMAGFGELPDQDTRLKMESFIDRL